MDNARDATCCGPKYAPVIWGTFLLAMAVGWLLNMAGWLDTSIWSFAGPLGLLFAAVMMFTMWRR